MWTGIAVYVALAVCALVFLSIAEDRAKRPVAGLIGGLIGATASVLAHPGINLVSFLATGLGFLTALLLRGWTTRLALIQETKELRGQAAWLEQRTNLARELHDVVGHHVTAMVVQAEAGQVSDPQAALRAIATTGRTTLGELDSLVVHLRDPAAPLSVTAPPRMSDIDELLAQPLRQQGVQVHVSVDADHGLDEPGVLATYRIVQEALTNIARHARASSAWVEVYRRGGPRTDTSQRRRNRPTHHQPARVRAARHPGASRSARRSLRVERKARRRHYAQRDIAGGCGVIRVAVVDDQQLVREGFGLILGSHPAIEVAVQAADGREFLEAVRKDRHLDVALVDIRMPVLDGLQATRELAAVPHAPAVIIVTTFDEDAYVLDAIAAGARGFLFKRCDSQELLAAVRAVAAGESILSPQVTGAVLERVRSIGNHASIDISPFALTTRETDVLA